MLIDRILFPITTLGPGKRLAIWTVGCSKHCQNCANPELWKFDRSRNISVEELTSSIHMALINQEVDGITISGGDPLEQAEELLELVESLADVSEDIIVYTGFTMKELEENLSGENLERLRNGISLLIDGPYMDALNDNKCMLRGSTNQNFIYMKEKFRQQYEFYLNGKRKIQNVYCGNKAVSVGIHNREN